MEKKNNKKKVVKPYDTRAVGIQLDRVEHSLELVAEQYGDIKQTLNVHTSKIDTITAKLDSHTSKLDSHKEMIGGMATDMEIIKADIEFIKQGFKKKVDMDEFSALERRVIMLERRRG